MPPCTFCLDDSKANKQIADMILGMTEEHPVQGPYLRQFKDEFRADLARAAKKDEPALGIAAVLSETFGLEALAYLQLAGSTRLLLERILGVSLPLRGQDTTRPPRWKTPPLEVFHDHGAFHFRLHYVVAKDCLSPEEYGKWVLYETTATEAGLTKEGACRMLESYRHHGKTFRVFLDGRVQRVRCLPHGIALVTLTAFNRNLIERQPTWTRPDTRALLERFATGAPAPLQPVNERFLRGLN